MHKKIFFLVIFVFQFLLNANSGDKLANGSCNFDIGTGYYYSKVFINKKQEVYLILAFNDPRYGTIEHVYNGKTCEAITSGNAYKSNFDKTIQNRGFQRIIYTSSKGYSKTTAIDKWFSAKTFLSLNLSDNIINLYVNPIDHNLRNNLNGIAYSITNKNAVFELPLNNNYFNKNINLIENAFIEILRDVPLENINFYSSYKIINFFPKLKKFLSKKVDSYLADNLSKISDIPKVDKLLKGFDKISKSYLIKYSKVKNFGKKLYFNTLHKSIEFQYVFRRINFDITFNEGTNHLILLVTKKPFSNKYILDINTRDMELIRTDTQTKVRGVNSVGEVFMAMLSLDNRITETVQYYKVKPRRGYLAKMRNIIRKLNPNNKENLLRYLENKREWNIQSTTLGTTSVAPTEEEIRQREIDRQIENMKKSCLSQCEGLSTKSPALFVSSPRSRCKSRCYGIH
jgi:hypothetical protein